MPEKSACIFSAFHDLDWSQHAMYVPKFPSRTLQGRIDYMIPDGRVLVRVSHEVPVYLLEHV